MQIYVGNLSYNTKQSQVQELLNTIGEAHITRWMCDKDDPTKSMGYCFAEMPDGLGIEAIDMLNNTILDGRNVRISEARPRNY